MSEIILDSVIDSIKAATLSFSYLSVYGMAGA